MGRSEDDRLSQRAWDLSSKSRLLPRFGGEPDGVILLFSHELRHMTPEQIKVHADEVRETSATVVRGLFPVETIDAWNAAFQPLLQQAIAAEGDDPNRGTSRYDVTLPFQGIWADPQIIDNDVVMAIVSELIGADGVMCQLASDTPMKGSDYQDLHRDTQLLFPETGAESPPYQLAVNFPLVDVTEANGPMEMAAGTHMLSKEEGLRRVATGETPLTPMLMNRGDVMIRDVRHIHRGTPNPGDQARPMVVIGYSRRWLYRPEVGIRVPRETLERLPDRARRWLRFNPVFEDTAEALQAGESYREFAY